MNTGYLHLADVFGDLCVLVLACPERFGTWKPTNRSTDNYQLLLARFMWDVSQSEVLWNHFKLSDLQITACVQKLTVYVFVCVFYLHFCCKVRTMEHPPRQIRSHRKIKKPKFCQKRLPGRRSGIPWACPPLKSVPTMQTLEAKLFESEIAVVFSDGIVKTSMDPHW